MQVLRRSPTRSLSSPRGPQEGPEKEGSKSNKTISVVGERTLAWRVLSRGGGPGGPEESPKRAPERTFLDLSKAVFRHLCPVLEPLGRSAGVVTQGPFP
eukprot:3494145-Pyramimonas_sp.AAC.1